MQLCQPIVLPIISGVHCQHWQRRTLWQRTRQQYLEAGLACKLAASCIDVALVGQDVQELQVVPLAGGKVVGVMCGRDLDSSRPKGHVHQLCVCDDGDLSAVQQMDHMLAMQMQIPERYDTVLNALDNLAQ